MSLQQHFYKGNLPLTYISPLTTTPTELIGVYKLYFFSIKAGVQSLVESYIKQQHSYTKASTRNKTPQQLRSPNSRI